MKEKFFPVDAKFYAQIKTYLFCLLTAAVLITLFSRSSFLYPFNNWSDTNVYMTIGREMLRGAVPYRDLFDHKGPLWYLLYLAANLISSKTFFGLYLIELFSLSIFLFYCWKLLVLFCPSLYAMAVLPFLGCLITISDAFGMGGSAEEIHLPFAAAGLYFLIRFLYDQEHDSGPMSGLTYPVLYVNGLLAGCVLWSKYSLLGFWFVWMASVFFLLLSQKEWKRSLLACLAFLSGMATVSAFCLIYLLAAGALSDFWQTYVVINLKYANVGEHRTLAERLHTSLRYFLMMLGWNKVLGMLTLAGIAAVTVFPIVSKSLLRRLIVPAIFLCSTAVAFMGKVSHFYYFLTTAPFLVLFFLVPGRLLTAFLRRRNRQDSRLLPTRTARRIAPVIVCAGTLAASCVFGWHRSPNVFYMDYRREDLTQYQAAAIIDREESPTLMYYGNLIDTGILMASQNARPWGKYYFMPNISYDAYPAIRDAQEAALRNREADFVFTYRYASESLRQNYHLVKYFPASEKDRGDSYLLMQANPYDLYAGCKLDFQEDGVFSYTLGEMDWTDQGDENAYVLIGALDRPVRAEQVTVVAPDGRTPELFPYVSEDGTHWISPDIRTEFDELSAHFPTMNLRYVKLVAPRNQTMNGLWQVRVYEPSKAGQRQKETGGSIRTISVSGAEHAEALEKLTDHDVTLGWDSTVPVSPELTLEIDLDRPYTVKKICLKTFEDHIACPESIRLYAGQTETEKGSMAPVAFSQDHNCLIPDQPFTAGQLLMIPEKRESSSWKIDELEIYVIP